MGEIYSDLGATARTSDGRGLSVSLLLDGVPVDPIEIGTAITRTYTITYRAEDQGQTQEVMRTVIVGSEASSTAPEVNGSATDEQPASASPDSSDQTSGDHTETPDDTEHNLEVAA